MSNNNSNIIVNTFNENNTYLTSVNFESIVTSFNTSNTSNVVSFNINTFNQNNRYFTSTNFERFVEGLLKLDIIIHKQMIKIKKKKIIINI
jgi:hypothetical protein